MHLRPPSFRRVSCVCINCATKRGGDTGHQTRWNQLRDIAETKGIIFKIISSSCWCLRLEKGHLLFISRDTRKNLSLQRQGGYLAVFVERVCTSANKEQGFWRVRFSDKSWLPPPTLLKFYTFLVFLHCGVINGSCQTRDTIPASSEPLISKRLHHPNCTPWLLRRHFAILWGSLVHSFILCKTDRNASNHNIVVVAAIYF